MTGLIAGLVMITYFIAAAITVPLLFGLFFRDLLDWAHAPVPGIAALLIGLVLQSGVITWICIMGAKASIKTTIRLMVIETGVVLALSATILWVKAGQPGGIDFGPFNPAHATRGLTGFWAAIILGMLAFSGFDVVATAAEEAQAPHHHVPRVLIFAIIGIALFWTVNAWVLTLSAPFDKVVDYSAQGLMVITPVARSYWGWGNLIVIATAFTGLTAIYISTVQGASRLIFALARHLSTPGAPRRTQWRRARSESRGSVRRVDLRYLWDREHCHPEKRAGQLRMVVERDGVLRRTHIHRG